MIVSKYIKILLCSVNKYSETVGKREKGIISCECKVQTQLLNTHNIGSLQNVLFTLKIFRTIKLLFRQ